MNRHNVGHKCTFNDGYCRNCAWNRELIIAIHTYVYTCWKIRNDVIHGKSDKSKKETERRDLQLKIIQLYDKGRANLTLKEMNYFKLPVEQRIKKGNESLRLWILIVENIFTKRGVARQETMDQWLVPSLPPDDDLAQPKVKNRTAALDNNLLEDGEEAS